MDARVAECGAYSRRIFERAQTAKPQPTRIDPRWRPIDV